MNIIDLIQADGGTLKRIGSTHGGEFAGACLFCGGNDRFRVWPETGRYWCRSCEKSGDSIQWLRERRGLSYIEACKVIGRDPGPRSNEQHQAPAAWEPREAKTPADAWQVRAKVFLDGAVSALWSRQGDKTRAWLHDAKGLNDATIQAAGLGFNPVDIYEPRALWGLESSLKENGQEKRHWIPAGLVIPFLIDGQVLRLRIRRADPGDGERYIIVSGSSSAPMTWGQDKGAAVIVESELDAILLNQDAGDLATCISIGSAQAKPDTLTHKLLTAAAVILVSLDTDDAGAKASWKFWPETYGKKAKRWPSINGKDASDARQKGLDLRQWVVAGMFGTEIKFERFCIQTTDGGLTDAEALQAMAR
ncbi:MAG: CHC2 zinc finger domain-containing protein [Syntrophales bacterium]